MLPVELTSGFGLLVEQVRRDGETPRSERMNKADIAGRVAERMGLRRSVAGDAGDAVFEVTGQTRAKGEEG